MPLPLPDLPAGCVTIVCQANLPGYQPTTKVLAPRMVVKIMSFLAEMRTIGINADGMAVSVPKYSGMTQLLESVLDEHLLSPIDRRYPDAPDQTIADLEAQLAAAKKAVQPKFIEPAIKKET